MKAEVWLRSWLEQVLLRRAPQDDEPSPAVLVLALMAYLLMDITQVLSDSTPMMAVAMSLADTVLLVLFVWALLALTGKRERLLQTLTGLAGTGALLGLIGLPLVLQAARAAQAGADPSALLALAWLLLLAWSLAVQAHIFRHALSVRYGVGMLVASVHTLLTVMILGVLFPSVVGGS